MWRFFQLVFAGAAVAATFQWDDVVAKPDLEYHDCYGGFQCARLILPLDWRNESNEATVEIAITKLPAVVNDTDPSYGGPIFTNPGGPGGSGVDYILLAGQALRNIADIPGKRHYDIVSFDPRGIGKSTPAIDCYPSGLLERAASGLETHGNGPLDSSIAALQYGLALSEANSQRCFSVHGDFLSYVGTPNVARDMVAIVDKIDEERKKRIGESADKKGKEEAQSRLELRSTDENNRKDEDDVPRLQYIGFSYGTILGNYFASLFPERIGRLILDGVCNTDDYAKGAGWLTSTVDADKVAQNFFKGCFEAGEDCALYKRGDKSGPDIALRFWAWIEELKEKPLIGTVNGDTIVLRSSDFLSITTLALYFPLSMFKPLASDLNQAMTGNATPVLERYAGMNGMPTLKDGCLISNATESAVVGAEARSAVLCVDGEDIQGHNSTWWSDYVGQQLSNSKVAGALWSNIRLACSSWKSQTNWPFRGPFKSPNPSGDPSKPEKGKPAAPLLFLSNRLDPVTPLRAARKMAKSHPGAGVLVQEDMGHTIMGQGLAGPCVKKVVSEYLDTGIVPKDEVSCEAVCGPWDKECAFSTSASPILYKRTIHNLM